MKKSDCNEAIFKKLYLPCFFIFFSCIDLLQLLIRNNIHIQIRTNAKYKKNDMEDRKKKEKERASGKFQYIQINSIQFSLVRF